MTEIILTSIWMLELFITFILWQYQDKTSGVPNFKHTCIQWLWLQAWLFTMIFWWFSPLESLSEKSFASMG